MTDILRGDNPEVARFIGSYKYDQDVSDKKSKFGGGTSLPLDSDGYEDRQRILKDELRKDFLHQQEKDVDRPVNMDPYAFKHAQVSYGPQSAADYESEIQKMTDRYHNRYNDTLFEADDESDGPVYFRVGTPEQGLRGLGDYEIQRQEMNVKRQREYNDFLREKKNLERQRVEARRSRPPPPESQAPAGQVDYNQQNLNARTEDRRAYQDHMGKYHQLNVVQSKPPINYEDDRKRLSEERRQEYAQMMEKKAQEERYWKMRGRPVTPDGGLDIGHYDKHLKEKAPLKKREYKESLDQQKDEKLRHKVWERVAEVSPSHMHYRDAERPLVGSPRDVNFHMHEKEERDRFGLIGRKLKPNSKNNGSPDKTTSVYHHIVARQLAKRDDENFGRYLEAEREKRKNQKTYREALEKQQKEHMYMRVRQEPEMPVLDRSGAQHATYVPSQPPPGPHQGHQHEPPMRQTPNYWNDGQRERSPVSLTSDQSKPGKGVKDTDAPLVNGHQSMGTKNSDIPLAFRTGSYNSQKPGPEQGQYREAPDRNGYHHMDRPQPSPPRSPHKSYNAPPPPRFMEQQYDDYQDQRPQLKSQNPQAQVNGEATSYQPSFQGQGQRSPDRSRPTPLAFQTGRNGGGGQKREENNRRPSPKEYVKLDLQDKPSKSNEQPDIGGLYVFDDSKHDVVKRQIHDIRKNDYQALLKKKEDERSRRQQDMMQHRSDPARLVKDHHYSSDEYEKFQRNLHAKEAEEYRVFLDKQYEPKWKIGLPLGQYKYEPKRLSMEHERNAEYNDQLTKKTFQPPANAQGLPIGQHVHEVKRLQMEAERNKEYNQMLKKRKPSLQQEGPQGLNIDVSYQSKKKAILERQRNKEYNEYMKKGEDRHGYEAPSQYPERYDNKNYEMDQVPKARYKSPVYGNNFDDKQSQRSLTPQRKWSANQQTSTNMSAVMTHHVHAPSAPTVMHREDAQQNVSHYPKSDNHFPSEPSYVPEPPDHLTDPYRTNPNRFHNQMTAPYPKAASVPADYRDIPATPNKLSLPLGSYDEARPFIQKERNREYNDYVSKLPQVNTNRGGMTPQATALTLPVGAYDTIRPALEQQRNKEYNHLMSSGRLEKKKGTLRDKAPTPPSQQGIFDSQDSYRGYQKNMERERNREYNEFLKQKYARGRTTSRSEPDKPNASFHYGHDDEHEMKRRYFAEERSKQYNEMLREQEPHRSRSVNLPNDKEAGLPIGQQLYESRRNFLRDQRQKEYNQMLDMKNQETHNRDWKYGNSGVLEFRGDDENKSKKAVLKEQRQKEYNQYMSQNQRKYNRSWPEPDGRGALLVHKGEYDSVRNMYSTERKQELQQYLHKKDGPQQVPEAPPKERRSRSEPGPPGTQNNFNPLVNALGKYNDRRQKLVDDRRKEFKNFMAEKKTYELEPRKPLVEVAPTKAGDEKPLVNSMGLYETEKKRKFAQERRKEFASFANEKEKHWTPRKNVKENIMPHAASSETPLVNYMGHYDDEKYKFRVERNKDLQEFAHKKKQEYHSPYDNYVYPVVAAAEKPLVDYMGRDVEQRKHELRQERRHEYERYQSKQRVRDPPRRHDYLDNKNSPYDGIFSGLGDHGNTKEVLGQQRKQEYNSHLEQYPHPKAQGRPTWVKETLPNNTDRGRSPMRNAQPVDHYQQMLDDKRREEAQRRRLDDHEYQYSSNRMGPGSRGSGGRYMGDMQQQKYGGYQPHE